MALTQTQVSQLYVSIFGRASEGEGNTYWQTNQPDMVTTANVMLDTDAAKDYFGATLDDNEDFIAFIYENTLGKTQTEDPDGVAYWVAELESGKSKGEVVTALVNAATDSENAGDAQDQFNNRVDVSNYCADNIEKFTNYTEMAGFIDGIDETDASVTTAEGLIDEAAKESDDTDADDIQGSTYQLTNSFVGTGAADNVMGTDGNDTISGATGTLESIDVVNGAGGGDDLLTVRMDATTNVAPVVSNIETIDIISRGTGSLNFADITGYTNVSLSGTSNYGLLSLPNNFEVTIKDTDSETMTLTLDNATGDSDALTVTLENVEGGTVAANQDLETLNIESSGDDANEVGLSATGFDVTNGTINITGAQDLSLEFGNNAGNGSSGTFSDIVLNASSFSGALTIVDGDNDTLDAKNFTGVDVFAFDVDNGNTYEVDNAEVGAAVEAIMETGDPTLWVNFDVNDAEKISSKTNTLAVTVDTDDGVEEDDFTLNLTTNKIETIAVTATGAADEDSTLAVNITDTAVKALSFDGDSLAAIDSLSLGGTALTAGSLTSLNLDGAATDINIAAIVTDAPASTPFEISLGSGDDTITSFTSTNNVSGAVALGSGDDAFTVVGGTGNLEIEGGAGDDNITTLAGDDQIEGGAGDDTISSGTGDDTVTGGTGTDAITLGGGTNVVVVDDGDSGITAVTADSVTGFVSGTDTLSLGTAGTAANYVEATGTGAFAACLAAANAAMDGTVLYYADDDGIDTFVFEDSDGDGTADQGIILTGITTGAGFALTDIVA